MHAFCCETHSNIIHCQSNMHTKFHWNLQFRIIDCKCLACLSRHWLPWQDKKELGFNPCICAGCVPNFNPKYGTLHFYDAPEDLPCGCPAIYSSSSCMCDDDGSGLPCGCDTILSCLCGKEKNGDASSSESEDGETVCSNEEIIWSSLCGPQSVRRSERIRNKKMIVHECAFC